MTAVLAILIGSGAGFVIFGLSAFRIYEQGRRAGQLRSRDFPSSGELAVAGYLYFDRIERITIIQAIGHYRAVLISVVDTDRPDSEQYRKRLAFVEKLADKLDPGGRKIEDWNKPQTEPAE